MQLKAETVLSLSSHYGWSQNELARRVGVSKGSLSRALSGKCGVGRKTISGLMRLFPCEPLESLVTKRAHVL